MKKVLIVTGLSVCLIAGCSHNPEQNSNGKHGLNGFLKGIAHLVLSPLQIASGLMEGVASLPYYANTSLHKINKGLEDAQAKITLDDTYESAYGKRISDVSNDGETNNRFRRMKHASSYLQKILKSYGVDNYAHYYLTSIDTAQRDGATLFAVIYRQKKSINVLDKYNHQSIRNYESKDRLFYEPFQFDVNGNEVDTIIDWAGISTESYKTQKMQAVLLTLAANAIIDGKQRDDYWGIEKQWISGEFKTIMKKRNSKINLLMLSNKEISNKSVI